MEGGCLRGRQKDDTHAARPGCQLSPDDALPLCLGKHLVVVLIHPDVPQFLYLPFQVFCTQHCSRTEGCSEQFAEVPWKMLIGGIAVDEFLVETVRVSFRL